MGQGGAATGGCGWLTSDGHLGLLGLQALESAVQYLSRAVERERGERMHCVEHL